MAHEYTGALLQTGNAMYSIETASFRVFPHDVKNCIIPAVLLVAVTVVKDMDEFDTLPEPLPMSAYSPPPPPPDKPRSIPHPTCTHRVSTRASHSKTTWIAESTQTPVMTQSLPPLPF
jgi:hypothetical protein